MWNENRQRYGVVSGSDKPAGSLRVSQGAFWELIGDVHMNYLQHFQCIVCGWKHYITEPLGRTVTCRSCGKHEDIQPHAWFKV